MSAPRAGAPASLLVAAACAGAGVRVAVVATGAEKLQVGAAVWIAGSARNAKAGAVVQAGDLVVHCADRAEWPREVEGRPVVAAGVLTTRTLPALPVGPAGERSGGAEGTLFVLSSCEPPPPADDGLLDAERALFAGLAARDPDRIARLVAPELILRVAGEPDADRAGFLAGVTNVPGAIVAVEGEGLAAHRAGDVGIVRGAQVARVRVDDKVVEERNAFVDVFVRRGGAWLLRFALFGP